MCVTTMISPQRLNEWVEWKLDDIEWWGCLTTRWSKERDGIVQRFLAKNWKPKDNKVKKDDRKSYNEDYKRPREQDLEDTREYRDFIRRLNRLDKVISSTVY